MSSPTLTIREGSVAGVETMMDAEFMVVAPLTDSKGSGVYAIMPLFEDDVKRWGDKAWEIISLHVTYMTWDIIEMGGDISRAKWEVRIPLELTPSH